MMLFCLCHLFRIQGQSFLNQSCSFSSRLGKIVLLHPCDTYTFFYSQACFVDSELPLDSDGSELLADTFDVLSLKEMKLTAMSGPAAGEEPQEDEMAMAKAVLQVAQKKLITQVRKHAAGKGRRGRVVGTVMAAAKPA